MIRTPEELQEAIDKLILGNNDVMDDIATYMSYNYYIYIHTIKHSAKDFENGRIYTDFEINRPDLFFKVEELITIKLEKFADNNE